MTSGASPHETCPSSATTLAAEFRDLFDTGYDFQVFLLCVIKVFFVYFLIFPFYLILT